ncbi:MAG: outer membrane protein, partial [Alphaproteobacteria bacterium]
MALSCAAATAVGPGVAAAGAGEAQSGGGWYATVVLLGAAAEVTRLDIDGMRAPYVESGWQAVAGGGVRLGRSFDGLPMRVELEVLHRYRFDLDIRDPSPAGLVDYETNIGTTSAAASLWIEHRSRWPVTPFVGATLGWAWHHVDTTRTLLSTGEASGRRRTLEEPVWGLGGGVAWDFVERWSAEAVWRYMNLGAVGTGTLAHGEA